MALRKALALDESDMAAAVQAIRAAGPSRSGGSHVGTVEGAGNRAFGRAVKYRSIAGDGFYDAVVQSHLPGGLVALEITVPGVASTLFYTGATVAKDAESCDLGQCYFV